MKTNNLKIFAFLLIIFIYSCSDKIADEEKITNHFYDKAFEYREKGNIDSSFFYFYKAKDVFLQQKDSFGIAKCLVNLSIIQETKGDYFGSQETALSALRYFNANDSLQNTYLSINYNTLGITASKLEDYRKAIKFNQQALKFADDLTNKNIYQNNLANNHRRIKNYNAAIRILDSLSEKSTAEDGSSHSRIIDNLGFTKWLQNRNYNPIPEFQKALNIRLQEKDNWGLNSSYSHLADYYTEKKTDSALFFARKMYETAKEIKSPDDKIEALQKLISLENPENSKQYFKIYQKLNDSLQTARNKAKNQFALIRYETEKNKADFLKAKAESAERQNKIIVRNILVISLVIFLIFSFLQYRKRQKRLQQEKLLEVKNTELKYSKKVHDVVANGLYHTMIEIQNNPELNKENILNRIEKMYEESRDIAQEEVLETDFFSRFSKMINSYNSYHQKVLIVGYKDDLWENVSERVQSELYYIVREMLVNMKKHSLAKLASLKFEKNENNLIIKYTDNGIGINNLENKKGTGIRNTENRIDAINGDLIFEKNPNGGLIIKITVPINSKYV